MQLMKPKPIERDISSITYITNVSYTSKRTRISSYLRLKVTIERETQF